MLLKLIIIAILAIIFGTFYRYNPSVPALLARCLLSVLTMMYIVKWADQSGNNRLILSVKVMIVIMLIGMVLNTTVIIANNGYMPTTPEIYDTSIPESIHPYISRGGRLLFLGDVITSAGFSIGDVIFLLSIPIATIYYTRNT